MTPTSEWKAVRSGLRVAVSSLSGNRYEGVLLGGSPAGLFLRMPGRGVVRLGSDRVDLNYEVLGSEAPLAPEDELILTPRGGRELRGRVVEAGPDRVALSVPGRGPLAIALVEIEPGSASLLFRAASLRPLDRFLLRSRSGREYRGEVLDLTPRYLVARLAGEGSEVRLRIDELDLRSVEVLIPLHFSESSPPSEAERAR